MSTSPLWHNVFLKSTKSTSLSKCCCGVLTHERVMHLQGVSVFKDRIAAADDPLVQRLKEKGAIIVGG